MKKRLDITITEKGLAPSRQRAQSLIMAGKVLVNDVISDKPGTPVSDADTIAVKGDDMPYVSRGGLKLEAAFQTFRLNAEGLICLDVGASTGGFTDCLLQHGAAKVYAVDVGYGQIAWKLRQDSRVIVIERTNIRYMPEEAVSEKADLVTIDTSFISLRIVIPAVIKFMNANASVFALIKPQFEVGKGKVGKGGVVRNSALHQEVIEEFRDFFIQSGFSCEGISESPILGTKGNKEFIAYLKRIL